LSGGLSHDAEEAHAPAEMEPALPAEQEPAAARELKAHRRLVAAKGALATVLAGRRRSSCRQEKLPKRCFAHLLKNFFAYLRKGAFTKVGKNAVKQDFPCWQTTGSGKSLHTFFFSLIPGSI
jgi:hypothetical protein